MPEKNKDKGVEAKTEQFKGKQLAIGVTGGIGAVEVIRIIRELRRHGAAITPFITPEGSRFVTPLSLEWAAERPLIQNWQSHVPHLEDFDAVVVVPATLNTISKAALGIADNVVTLLIASQLGAKRPVLFFPTMNMRLRKHPRYEESTALLTKWGSIFFEKEEQEGRLKMPTLEEVVEALCKVLYY